MPISKKEIQPPLQSRTFRVNYHELSYTKGHKCQLQHHMTEILHQLNTKNIRITPSKATYLVETLPMPALPRPQEPAFMCTAHLGCRSYSNPIPNLVQQLNSLSRE